MPEPVVSMALDTSTASTVFRSGSGHLWGLGNVVGCNGSRQSSRQARKIKIPNRYLFGHVEETCNALRRKCVSIAATKGAFVYATENGQCFMHGRHAVTGHNECGPVTSFDNIPAASVALGKTHMVAVNRNGLVYTCGMNNLNQCGREIALEQPFVSSSSYSPSSRSTGHSSLSQDPARTPSPKCERFCKTHFAILDLNIAFSGTLCECLNFGYILIRLLLRGRTHLR